MLTGAMDTKRRRSALKPLLREPTRRTRADWKHIGLFAGGITVGIVLGAGAALLLAPASGSEVRDRIARRFRGAEGSDSVWEDLERELEEAETELAKAT